MDCLVRAFAEVTSTPVEELISLIGHPAPHHIQEIIDVLSERWHITEYLFDDLGFECPLGHKCPVICPVDYKSSKDRIISIMRKYNGVCTYWTGLDQQHAVAWKNTDDFSNRIISIFWRVERRFIEDHLHINCQK